MSDTANHFEPLPERELNRLLRSVRESNNRQELSTAVQQLALGGHIVATSEILEQRIKAGGRRLREDLSAIGASTVNLTTQAYLVDLKRVPVAYTHFAHGNDIALPETLAEYYADQCLTQDRYDFIAALSAVRLIDGQAIEATDGHFDLIDESLPQRADQDWVASRLIDLELILEADDVKTVREAWERLNEVPRKDNLIMVWLRQRDLSTTSIDLQLYLLARLPSAELSTALIQQALRDAHSSRQPGDIRQRIRFAQAITQNHRRILSDRPLAEDITRLAQLAQASVSEYKNLVSQLEKADLSVPSLIAVERYREESLSAVDIASLRGSLSLAQTFVDEIADELLSKLSEAASIPGDPNQAARARLMPALKHLLDEDFATTARTVIADKTQPTVLRNWFRGELNARTPSDSVAPPAVQQPLPGLGGRTTSRVRNPGGPRRPGPWWRSLRQARPVSSAEANVVGSVIDSGESALPPELAADLQEMIWDSNSLTETLVAATLSLRVGPGTDENLEQVMGTVARNDHIDVGQQQIILDFLEGYRSLSVNMSVRTIEEIVNGLYDRFGHERQDLVRFLIAPVVRLQRLRLEQEMASDPYRAEVDKLIALVGPGQAALILEDIANAGDCSRQVQGRARRNIIRCKQRTENEANYPSQGLMFDENLNPMPGL